MPHHVIITSYKEIDTTEKAIESFLRQKTKKKFKITVIDPFPEVKDRLKKKYKNKVDFFLDPGEGKSYALNVFLEKIYSKDKDNMIIFTDGDVYVSENAVEEILKAFKDPKVGCVTGRPVPLNSRKNKIGYWYHLLFDGIHKVRKKLSSQGKFFECSGYLFAIRNGVLQGFPLEVSEDSIIPYLFWKKGYKIKYVPKAEVYVLCPQTWKEHKMQKIRNIKGHENLDKVAKGMPRTKSFLNEIKEGVVFSLKYPKSFREFLWTVELMFVRLYLYCMAFYEMWFRKKEYSDGWRADERPLT